MDIRWIRILVFLPAVLDLCRASNVDVDFDLSDHIRVIRGGNEYDIGGPLAKEGAGSAGTEAPGTGATEKPAAHPPAASPPPGEKPPDKGGGKSGCAISVFPSSVLSEIGSNSAKLPEYNLKYMDDCKSIGECTKLCEKAACNYFIRSTDSEKTHFYTVEASKLSGSSYVESNSFDSFVPQCPAQEKLPEFGAGAAAGNATKGPESGPGAGTGATKAGLETSAAPNMAAEGNATTGPVHVRKPSVPVDNCPECTLKDRFKKFLLSQNRTFNPYEEERRFQIFQDALARIEQLNHERVNLIADANFTVTKFTDRVFGEFLQFSTGAIPEDNPADKFEEDVGVVPGVPSRFDWTDEGVVPPPRDQMDCGSCYAFASTDLAATQWAIDHGEKKFYINAPQVVLDCVKAPAAFGCNGGRPYLVLSTQANCSTCPWPRETCYPYENKAADCKAAEKLCIDTDEPRILVKHAHYLDVSSKGEQERLSALLQGGPIAALVQVTDHWQYYSGGVMRASQCKNSTAKPNHAVLITGYDFTGEVPAYIIKNSWGPDWGEEGYFRLEAGSNACGVSKFLSFACTADCGDKKSVKQLVDRALRRQKERGYGTTTPQPQTPGYAVPAPSPTQVPYIASTAYLPAIAPPPPRPPTYAPVQTEATSVPKTEGYAPPAVTPPPKPPVASTVAKPEIQQPSAGYEKPPPPIAQSQVATQASISASKSAPASIPQTPAASPISAVHSGLSTPSYANQPSGAPQAPSAQPSQPSQNSVAATPRTASAPGPAQPPAPTGGKYEAGQLRRLRI